ncbi:MAG: SGNH/GDSL hydrolase family protein [Clostridia bacterium]|nr:SGNH/GDSL hydrolase family protein [Clostridia bacterium]
MKKLTALLLFVCVLASCLLLCACQPPSPPEPPAPEIPDVLYDIEQDFSALQPNDAKFLLDNVTPREDSPLKDKVIYWLGSSVTYGSASNGVSMADYLAKLTGCISKKDAVSGTTLFDDNKTADTGVNSYTRRLINSTVFDKNEKVDAFICQISTNDARNDRLDKRGKLTDENNDDINSFNKATTIGAMEFIIAYVHETWGCPVYFYSGSYFGDTGTRKSTNPTGTNYATLVQQTHQVVEKWNGFYGYRVGVIDLFNDEEFNTVVSDEYYKWATSDAIHPKHAGYLQWWTPYFEQFLIVELTINIYEE